MNKTPILSAIYIYPVKSCRGISVTSAHLDTWGLERDRNWMVVNADNRFLTQRQQPRLALVETALEQNYLCLSAPNMPYLRISLSPILGKEINVTIWQDYCRSIDQGDEAAEWFSTFLGINCRLVRMTEKFTRPVNSATHAAQVNFADGFPILMLSEASLADLNTRITEPLPMNRFRPNLVVSGCEPFAEDSWDTLQISEVTFHRAKSCDRCIITTIDQTTGIRGQEPLSTLATYRRVKGKVLFGQNLVHTGTGEVRIGDIILV